MSRFILGLRNAGNSTSGDNSITSHQQSGTLHFADAATLVGNLGAPLRDCPEDNDALDDSEKVLYISMEDGKAETRSLEA